MLLAGILDLMTIDLLRVLQAKSRVQTAADAAALAAAQELRLLAYVFADGLRRDNGRAFELREGLELAARQRGGACYVVEVCTDCCWNHLSEAFMARSAG